MNQLKERSETLNFQSEKRRSGVVNKLRRLKVYYKVGWTKDIPVILLQGEWIRNLGFNVKDRIVVSGENGRLEVRLEE